MFVRAGVRSGGVHTVSSDSTLRQLLETAGVPLAPPEPDQAVRITWPASSGPAPRNRTRSDTPPPDPRLNINTASAEELRGLPGIGEVKSRRILHHRARHGPFEGPGDLTRVKGIGRATAGELEPLIRY